MFPELSMSNILKAQPTSSWNLKIDFMTEFIIYDECLLISSNKIKSQHQLHESNSARTVAVQGSDMTKKYKNICQIDPFPLHSPEHHIREVLARAYCWEEVPELLGGDLAFVILDKPFDHVNSLTLINISSGTK